MPADRRFAPAVLLHLHSDVRLWTLHPRHLDSKGLVAVWREGLLAQAVLLGRTHGYTNHPQLIRFKAAPDPVSAIAAYLLAVSCEAVARGYSFDRSRIIDAAPLRAPLVETRGQLSFEWSHLGKKLRSRAPAWWAEHHCRIRPSSNPIFRITSGDVREWERVSGHEGTKSRV